MSLDMSVTFDMCTYTVVWLDATKEYALHAFLGLKVKTSLANDSMTVMMHS